MKQRRKILVVDNMAVEASRRGVYRELAQREEFEVHLLAPASWRESAVPVACEPEPDGSLHLHSSRLLFGYRHHRILYVRLLSLIRSLKPDFLWIDTEPENYESVQAHYGRLWYAPRARLALFSSRNIDHGKVGFPYKLEWTHRICESVHRRNPIDLLFVRTRAAVPLLTHIARRVICLPFPIDCQQFRKIEAARDSSSEREVTVGYVGRLTEAKGVRLLLEAVARIKGNLRLLMVGTGPLESELRRMAKELGIADRFSLLPAVRHDVIPLMMSQIDIIVVPSLSTRLWKEQCPRVLIEAMACEVPIIGSDSGGIPEVLSDAGLLFSEGEVDDLVQKLAILVENPGLRRDLSRWGRGRALQVYDVPVIAGAAAGSIADILKDSGGN